MGLTRIVLKLEVLLLHAENCSSTPAVAAVGEPRGG